MTIQETPQPPEIVMVPVPVDRLPEVYRVLGAPAPSLPISLAREDFWTGLKLRELMTELPKHHRPLFDQLAHVAANTGGWLSITDLAASYNADASHIRGLLSGLTRVKNRLFGEDIPWPIEVSKNADGIAQYRMPDDIARRYLHIARTLQ